MTESVNNSDVTNNLVESLSGLVHHMRALENSRRKAEQCFADYAAHSIKLILSDSKAESECSVNNLEVKLSSMQHLLGQSEAERQRAEHLFATIDSHLKMLTRRNNNNASSNSVENSALQTSNSTMENNPGKSGAPFVRAGQPKERVYTKTNPGKQNESTNYIPNIGKRANNQVQTVAPCALTDRCLQNDTFSVDKTTCSALGNRYASTSSCPIPSQQSETSVNNSRSAKATNKDKAQITSMDQASPRALFHMLLTLEEEYDTLERERLDCLALRESAATSRQVTRKLDDRQRELRRQLDRKAVQVDRILKVLEPKLQIQAAKGQTHSDSAGHIKRMNTGPKLNNLSKGMNKTAHNELWDVEDGSSSPGSLVETNLPQNGYGDTSLEGNSPPLVRDVRKGMRRKAPVKRQTPEKFNYERYHNVKLLREMKDFNRFLKSTRTFC
ncbi:uncharacterized protein LOC142341506 isoform X3 [Convolutriloba macropyga]|uniref:uncharacterized protein LOC142341506 isoform X3 n=1 Tax=Convolutriloba macropyga TaxID=536237 RepID=UPI003F528B53